MPGSWIRLSGGVVFFGLIVPALGNEGAPKGLPARWEGPLLKPTVRQEVFEFAEAPTFTKTGPDRYEIAFAAKGYCDVAVALCDSEGKIIKHIVYGVLGPNAPDPLQKNSLKQTIVWNGKDDQGKYVSHVESLKLRVSLGLKAEFDKIIGWHPKDINGTVTALGADPEGVYVLIGAGGFSTIRVFHHDGTYRKTIYPFPADRLNLVQGLDLQAVEGQPVGVPRRNRFADISPYGAIGSVKNYRTTLAIHDGLIFIPGADYFSPMIRLATDGSTRGVPAEGPKLASFKAQFGACVEPAISPDGKWFYVTRLFPGGQNLNPFVPFKAGTDRRGGMCRHAVYRVAVDAQTSKPIEVNVSFFGEGGKPGKDNLHLDHPEGVATDAQGRVYVADCNNNRVVVLTPDGSFLGAIPITRPRRLAVHARTGDIYGTAFDWQKDDIRIFKFSPFPGAKLQFEQKVPALRPHGRDGGQYCQHTVFALDSWADPPRIWLAEGPEVQIFEERKGRLEKGENFTETVRRDGYHPHALADGYRMVRVTADPLRGHLYYTNDNSSVVYRFDPEEGKKALPIRVTGKGGTMLVPGSGTRSLSLVDDVHMGQDGLFYCRSIQYLARFDPTVLEPDPETGGYRFVKEIPFDYGEIRDGGLDFPRGGIQLPAMIPGNGFNMGMGVAPNGDIMALCDNYHSASSIANFNNKYFNPETSSIKLPQNRFRPPMFPGRHWTFSTLVFVWDKKGQLIGKDLIAAPEGHTSGIRGDRDGNIYIGLAAYPMIDGKPYGPFGGSKIGPGAVVKFPPGGGKIFGTWGTPVPLDKEPNRPPDFTVGRGSKIWTENMIWSVGGLSTIGVEGTCRCPQSRFDVDVFGRVFIPETWRFSVNVVDTNGNQVMRIGRYGNADSGRGSQSPVPVPGGIAFSQCDYLCTVTDRWLYVSDSGNFRIVRIKLGYQAEKSASLR